MRTKKWQWHAVAKKLMLKSIGCPRTFWFECFSVITMTGGIQSSKIINIHRWRWQTENIVSSWRSLTRTLRYLTLLSEMCRRVGGMSTTNWLTRTLSRRNWSNMISSEVCRQLNDVQGDLQGSILTLQVGRTGTSSLEVRQRLNVGGDLEGGVQRMLPVGRTGSFVEAWLLNVEH